MVFGPRSHNMICMHNLHIVYGFLSPAKRCKYFEKENDKRPLPLFFRKKTNGHEKSHIFVVGDLTMGEFNHDNTIPASSFQNL